MTDNLLLCCDLDRTVLPNGHQPESPGAREIFSTIAQLPQITLAYVSGRDRSLLLEAIEKYEIPVPDFAIGDVGSAMYRITGSDWQKISAWSDHIGEDWFGIDNNIIVNLSLQQPELALQEPEKQGRYKISFYAPVDIDQNSLLNKLNKLLKEKNIPANLIWSIDEVNNTGLLDILPARANKKHAIDFLINETGFTTPQTVFAGDSGNDIPVIISEIPSVLVKNASDTVRKEVQEAVSNNGNADYIYLAKGGCLGMNGNYAAGIIEGLLHYHPELTELINK